MATVKERQIENIIKQLTNPETLKGVLHIFNQVIPQGLIVRIQTMLQENKLDLEIIGELTKVVVNYNVKLHNSALWEDEIVLWGHNEVKSNLDSKIHKTWAVTNQRAFVFDHSVESFEVVVGLLVCEVDVVNEHSKDLVGCIGVFLGKSWIKNENTSPDRSPATCGDVIFARDGVETLRFSNVDDPKIVKIIVEMAQKKLLCKQSA